MQQMFGRRILGGSYDAFRLELGFQAGGVFSPHAVGGKRPSTASHSGPEGSSDLPDDRLFEKAQVGQGAAAQSRMLRLVHIKRSTHRVPCITCKVVVYQRQLSLGNAVFPTMTLSQSRPFKL